MRPREVIWDLGEASALLRGHLSRLFELCHASPRRLGPYSGLTSGEPSEANHFARLSAGFKE